MNIDILVSSPVNLKIFITIYQLKYKSYMIVKALSKLLPHLVVQRYQTELYLNDFNNVSHIIF